MRPGMTALVLVMGANALVTGVLDIVVAIRSRKSIKTEWLLALAFRARGWRQRVPINAPAHA